MKERNGSQLKLFCALLTVAISIVFSVAYGQAPPAGFQGYAVTPAAVATPGAAVTPLPPGASPTATPLAQATPASPFATPTMTPPAVAPGATPPAPGVTPMMTPSAPGMPTPVASPVATPIGTPAVGAVLGAITPAPTPVNPFAAPAPTAAPTPPGAEAIPGAAVTPAAAPFASPTPPGPSLTPALDAGMPAATPPAATSPVPVDEAGTAGFADPFARRTGAPGLPDQPGQPSVAVPEPPKYEPPHDLIIQMRKAIAEQRYEEIKSLADQYKVVDPQSGLSDFFVNLARIRLDTITERTELGGLVLAQYGARRSPTTQPLSDQTGLAALPSAGASPTPFDLAQSPTQTPPKIPASPATGLATPAPTVAAAVTPTPATAVAPAPAPAPLPVSPPAPAAEPAWKTFMLPTIIGVAVLAILIFAVMALRSRRARKAALEPAAPAPEVAAASATATALGTVTAEEELGFEAPFATEDVTSPTQTPGVAPWEPFESPAVEPAEEEFQPSPTGELPMEPEALAPAESGILEVEQSLDEFSDETVRIQEEPEDEFEFMPSEPPLALDETVQSTFDIGSMEAKSELPSRDEILSGLDFEDLVTGASAPSQMSDQPSKETGSAFSLNDFESIADRSNLGEESGGAISFDDLVISKPSAMPAEESVSGFDLGGMEFPSMPPSEIDESFISDYDEVSDMGSDVEQTKGFQQQFENLMFGTTPPPPPLDETAGSTKTGETTDTSVSASTKQSFGASPEDTRPSDLGPDLSETDTKSDRQTTADFSSADTSYEVPGFDQDTKDLTPPPPPEPKK